MYFSPRFGFSFVRNSYRNILHIRFSNTFFVPVRENFSDGRNVFFKFPANFPLRGCSIVEGNLSKRKF